jgi:RNA-binding protein
LKAELKKFLRTKAHSLKPVVITGQHGASPNVLSEIERALDHHELIKVRVNAGDREQRQTLTKEILAATSAELIQSIGHIITLYRRHTGQR